jgi:hypothetical protein
MTPARSRPPPAPTSERKRRSRRLRPRVLAHVRPLRRAHRRRGGDPQYRVASGICLIVERDPITTRKSRERRPPFRRPPVAHLGPVPARAHAQPQPARPNGRRAGEGRGDEGDLDHDEASYHAKYVNFDRIWSWPSRRNGHTHPSSLAAPAQPPPIGCLGSATPGSPITTPSENVGHDLDTGCWSRGPSRCTFAPALTSAASAVRTCPEP